MHLKGLLYAGFICYLCMFAGAAGSIRRRPRARFAALLPGVTGGRLGEQHEH